MNDIKSYEPCKWNTDALFGPDVDSYNRVYLLLDLMDEASSREGVWRLFNIGWSACDAVRPESVAELLEILTYERPYGTQFLEGNDKAFFDGLPDAITIYRGCTPTRKNGISWTTGLEIAEGFALGHRGINVPDGTIYKAVAEKADILTVLTDRGEDEVIVDPRSLGEITVVKALGR